MDPNQDTSQSDPNQSDTSGGYSTPSDTNAAPVDTSPAPTDQPQDQPPADQPPADQPPADQPPGDVQNPDSYSISGPGTPAPQDQTNVDVTTGQVYPPGVIPPVSSTQVNIPGDISAQITSGITNGLKDFQTVNPNLLAATQQAANIAAQNEYNRWKAQLELTNLTANQKETIALDKARLAADTAIRQAGLAFQQRQLDLQYTQMTPYEKEQLATQRAIADLQAQTQKALQGTQIASTEKIQQWQLAQQERQSGRQTALGLIQQIAALKGPQNAFAQLRALNAIPGGLASLVKALGGEFNIPGMAGVNQGTPAGLSATMNDITSGGSGQMTTSDQQAAGTFVNPNQVPIQNWQNLPDYAKQVALAQWENQGLDPGLVESVIKNNAPQFQTPVVGRVAGFV